MFIKDLPLLRLIGMFALACVGISPVHAANQGTLGATSTGDFAVSIEIPQQVRLTGLTDVDFGTYTGSGNLDTNYNVCVYSNTPAAGYNVLAVGSGAGGAYTITNGGTTIPYHLYWNDQTGTAGGFAFISGNWLNNQTGANQSSNDCSVGGDSANIRVLLLQGDLQGKPNGTYTGTITLTVEAN